MNGSCRQLGLTLLYQEVFLEEASAAAVDRLPIAAIAGSTTPHRQGFAPMTFHPLMFQTLKPHIFTVGEQTYRNVKSLMEPVNQSVVVSGESGAGKVGGPPSHPVSFMTGWAGRQAGLGLQGVSLVESACSTGWDLGRSQEPGVLGRLFRQLCPDLRGESFLSEPSCPHRRTLPTLRAIGN